MKRSEMITNIKDLIEANLESLRLVPDAELLASLILHHQEQKGMKPPEWIKTVEGRWGAEKHKGWEPE